jgi:hypothetical protein
MRFIAILFILSACSSKTGVLTEKARELDIYQTKPKDCPVVGRVIGIDKNGSKELALNHALNQAAEFNGSGVFINQEVPNGKTVEVHASVYRCE